MDIVILNPKDNVAVAVHDIAAGDVIAGPDNTKITAQTDVPSGHKIALAQLDERDGVFKYGEFIGHASQPIRAGEHVHIHNLYLEEG